MLIQRCRLSALASQWGTGDELCPAGSAMPPARTSLSAQYSQCVRLLRSYSCCTHNVQCAEPCF